MTYGKLGPQSAFYPKPGQVQAAALDAMRETAAPIGSHWRRSTGEVWQLVERTGATVLLHLPGTRRHKSGLLQHLLKNYTRTL